MRSNYWLVDRERRSLERRRVDVEKLYADCNDFQAAYKPKATIMGLEKDRDLLEKNRAILAESVRRLEAVRRQLEADRAALEARRLRRSDYDRELRALVSRLEQGYLAPMELEIDLYRLYNRSVAAYYLTAAKAGEKCRDGTNQPAEGESEFVKALKAFTKKAQARLQD